MSFLKTKAVFSKIVKFQLFGLLLIALSCSFGLMQAQAANILISDIQNGLLENFGEDLSAVETAGNLNIPDTYGMTPLMYAVRSPVGGSNSSGKSIALTMIQNLLQAGADITIVNKINGKTTLMYAVESLNDGVDQQTGQPIILEILQILLTQKNSSATGFLISSTLLNAKDNTGKTALDYAMSSKNFQAPRITMTLLLTPGIESMVSLTTIQKTTVEFFSALRQINGINVSVNPNFFSTQPSLPPPPTMTIDVNAQDFTGTTALMYLAPFAVVTPNPQASNLTATNQLISDLQKATVTLATIQNDISAGAALDGEILKGALQLPSSNTDQAAIVALIASNILVNAILNTPNLNLNLTNISGKKASDLAPGLSALTNAQTAQTNSIATLFNDINSGIFTGVTKNNINTQDPTQGNNGATPLMLAAAGANPQANIQVLSQFNVDYNAQDYNGQTALTYAALGQSPVAAIQALLAIKDSSNNSVVDVNMQDDDGMTALMNALNLNNYAPTFTTPQTQISSTVTALLSATNINFALKDYSQPTSQTVLDYASLLAKNSTLATAESAAIVNAITTAIETTYSTSLLTAINSSDLTTANQVINDIVQSGISIDIQDVNGVTPLMRAAESQSNIIDGNNIPSVPTIVEIITALLLAQANVNATDNQGITPLMYAAGSLNNAINSQTKLAIVVEIITTLLENYALVTMQDKNKLTAYDYANKSTNSNQKAILTKLINAANTQLFEDIQNSTVTLAIIQTDLLAGASINATDRDQETPLYYAQQLPAANKEKAQIIAILTPPDAVSLGKKQAVTPVKSQTTVAPAIPTVPAQVPQKTVLRAIPTAPVVSDKSTAVQQKPKSKIKTIKRAKTVK